MAEKQVSTAADGANRPSDVETVQDSAECLVREAPEPSGKASKSYRVAYPTDQFVVPGHPVVTTAGTPLTDAQAKEVLPAAEASGVRIVEVAD